MSLDLTRLDVMVVNPSRALQQILKQIMWEVGLRRLRGLPSGGEALRSMADSQPDILFIDAALPDGRGTDLVRRIRRSPESPTPFVATIMTIGDPTLEKIMAARDAGADEVVIRPVTVKGVLQKLSAVIDRPRSMILAPTFIGPDRRHAGMAPPPGGNRRNPMRRDAFEAAPMPLLQMKHRGERREAEQLVTEARRVLRNLRMTWIDGDLDRLSRLLGEVSDNGTIDNYKPVLLDRLQSAVRTMDEHGYDTAAGIAGQLITLLERGAGGGRAAQLLKVNVDSLRAVIHARPEASNELARDIARGLEQLIGPPGR